MRCRHITDCELSVDFFTAHSDVQVFFTARRYASAVFATARSHG